MNLELLDPFHRQVPDRIDSTLSLAPALHFRQYHSPSSSSSSSSVTAHSSPATTNYNHASTTTTAKTKTAKRSKKNSSTNITANKSSSSAAAAQQDQDYLAGYHLSFNRRGSFLACGYGSGTIAIFSVLSRSLVSLYHGSSSSSSSSGEDDDNNTNNKTSTLTTKEGGRKAEEDEGVTSVSWSRHSRVLIGGAVGDTLIQLWDNTHPYGSHQASVGCLRLQQQQQQQQGGGGEPSTVQATPAKKPLEEAESPVSVKTNATATTSTPQQPTAAAAAAANTTESSTAAEEEDENSRNIMYSSERKHIESHTLQPGSLEIPVSFVSSSQPQILNTDFTLKTTRHPCVSFDLGLPVGGPVQCCPRVPTGGLAVLYDGSLVIFYVPKNAFSQSYRQQSSPAQGAVQQQQQQQQQQELAPSSSRAIIIPLWKDSSCPVTCAAFDHRGDKVFAATRHGELLGFDVSTLWDTLLRQQQPLTATTFQQSPQQTLLPNSLSPKFKITIGGSTAWHLLISRNGKYLVVNSSDGALRLYSTLELWDHSQSIDKPRWLFQDVVSKVKFVCCDLSGMDGEFLVGGSNGDDNKYELYIWNTTTGALMDKLTGSPVQLYSIAWHPTRSFIAVATSDGLIDVWGPRINWTAFAPDFQALPMNVEYVEEEDEFDLDEHGKFVSEGQEAEGKQDNENEIVDVLTVEKVPVFASDSEEEEDVFNFETKLCVARKKGSRLSADVVVSR